MLQISQARRAEEGAGSSAAESKELLFFFGLLAAATLVFGLLFNRESVLNYAIGYNLYSAERVLAGEVPYRDFHTLYPPATLYLNAAIFKYLGVSLYNALAGVLVFKVLTTLALYLCGRIVMPRAWALGAAAFSLLWLRPNGPFKAVPMHYGALFLALALLLFLIYERRRRPLALFAAGVALGVLALFKHNIGAYALFGLAAALVADSAGYRFRAREIINSVAPVAPLLSGFALIIAPVVIFMASRGAFKEMARTLLFGPGDFLVSRLASFPSPLATLLLVAWLAACSYVAVRLKGRKWLSTLAWVTTLASLFTILPGGDQAAVDTIIFYTPILVLVTAIAAFVRGREGVDRPLAYLSVAVIAAAAFLESFPRFAREQVVAAAPFVALLLFLVLYTFKHSIEPITGSRRSARLALTLVPLAFLLMGGRLFHATYFDGGLRLKSRTELTIERGRGVYFPADRARQIDEVVRYVQARVPEDGYLFPHSYVGSSFLFLADRQNPSGAQFWAGVGVTDAERAKTLEALEAKGVRLVITSDRDMAAESYLPFAQYMNSNYRLMEQFGDVQIFER